MSRPRSGFIYIYVAVIPNLCRDHSDARCRLPAALASRIGSTGSWPSLVEPCRRLCHRPHARHPPRPISEDDGPGRSQPSGPGQSLEVAFGYRKEIPHHDLCDSWDASRTGRGDHVEHGIKGIPVGLFRRPEGPASGLEGGLSVAGDPAAGAVCHACRRRRLRRDRVLGPAEPGLSPSLPAVPARHPLARHAERSGQRPRSGTVQGVLRQLGRRASGA